MAKLKRNFLANTSTRGMGKLICNKHALVSRGAAFPIGLPAWVAVRQGQRRGDWWPSDAARPAAGDQESAGRASARGVRARRWGVCSVGW